MPKRPQSRNKGTKAKSKAAAKNGVRSRPAGVFLPPHDPHAATIAAFQGLDHVAWATGLLLASLMEPRSTSALQQDLAACGVRDASDPKRDRSISAMAIKQALSELRELGIVTSDGGFGHQISAALCHRIVGTSAPPLAKLDAALKSARVRPPDRSGHRIPGATDPKKLGDRSHNFCLISLYVLGDSDFHRFGFYGRDRDTHIIREVRILYWLGDFDELVKRIENNVGVIGHRDRAFFLFPIDPQRLDKLSTPIRSFMLEVGLAGAIFEPADCTKLIGYAENVPAPCQSWRLLGEIHLLRADIDLLESTIEELERVGKDSPAGDGGEWLATAAQLRASQLFWRGENDAAIKQFERSLEHQKGKSRKRKLCPRGLGGLFFVLALCRKGDSESIRLAAQYAQWGKQLNETVFAGQFDLLTDLADSLSGGNREIENRVAAHRGYYTESPAPNLFMLLFILLSRLNGEPRTSQSEWRAQLDLLIANAEQSGFLLLAHEAASLRDDLPNAKPGATTKRLRSRLGFDAVPFTTAFKAALPWEKTLLGIETVAATQAKKSSKNGDAKTVATARKELFWYLETWEIDKWEVETWDDEPTDEEPPCIDLRWSLTPYERTISKTGRASKGKKIALRRLKETPDQLPFATAQDREVSSYVRPFRSWDSRTTYGINSPKALLALAGHPLLYTDPEDPTPIELLASTLRLDIAEGPEGSVNLRLVPSIEIGKAAAVLRAESKTRLEVYEIRPVHRKLAELLHRGETTEIPAAARERLLAAVSALSGEINIEADRVLGDATDTGTNTEAIAGDATPHLRLLPGGRGLDIRLLIRPVPDSSIEHPPGEGKAVLFAAVDEKRYQATRDLDAEKHQSELVIQNCPTLQRRRGEHSDPWQWNLEHPAECLQLLDELRALDDADSPIAVRVEWPEGQPFRIVGRADSEQLKLTLGSGGKSDWLEASGELEIDEQRVLGMRQLLDLLDTDLEDSDRAEFARRGFVRIGDNEFLALSENLQRQLNDLHAAASVGGKSPTKSNSDEDSVKIHPLAAFAVEELTRDATVVGRKSKAWTEQLRRLDAARDHHPDPPKTLRAELRPYQLDGYRWLSRLAVLGAGACLADDMGLGKTIQALAVLLERARLGPSLVVAPTSVAANWINETLRFAPTLQPLRFGDGDRAAMLDDLHPGDLVILSYGLLHTEIEKLAAIEWNTVILDEAQAIKNRDTQRSKAAMKLRAGFRIITTGTPVENRLAELHNLFQFVNPGLLGSREQFHQQFADPIEQDDDRSARNRLRRLIRPFLLRRLKSEVLRDLPPRTDIELSVEPSEEEASFYEALRRKALDEIESADSDNAPGGAAIRILAQLTRLRRACCHPRLIDPNTDLPGSKLRVFADTLSEILAGDHKVLVFSQFVGHLAIVREHLEAEEISYQYLDGSTPTKKRQQAVDAFQSGDGDVFLISLKAGGFGLNLTAADYVIHLDPWWNPAAEDQASDRAHRIGQQRPVTVYRLIVQNSIEEKIVNLHHRKRELAESLLEGTGKAARLTPDDMLELLRS